MKIALWHWNENDCELRREIALAATVNKLPIVNTSEDGSRFLFKDGTPAWFIVFAPFLTVQYHHGSAFSTPAQESEEGKQWVREHPEAWAQLLQLKPYVHTEMLGMTSGGSLFFSGTFEKVLEQLKGLISEYEQGE